MNYKKMVDKINANKLGLTFGLFVAIWHALWALLVGIGVAQNALDWVLPLHFFSFTFSILAFSWTNAIILIIAAFVGGYVMGWLFAELWNCKCMKHRR